MDKSEYILIKGGTYVMGETKREVTVPDLYFARYPVTNRLYREFMKAAGHREPKYWDDKRFNGDDQPVVGVDWSDATAYCQWLAGTNKDSVTYRLPTEEEWEWAAGRGKRTYPWGDEEPDDQRANWNNNVGQTTPVGSYPSGATPEGLMDMAGNVWEWTDSWYGKPEKSDRVVRGGSWFGISPGRLSCAYRGLRISDDGFSDSGFRVVHAVR